MDRDRDTHTVYNPPAFDPYEGENSSVYTRVTSGVLAPDNSEKRNDLGYSEAEEVANSYRTSKLDAPQQSSSTGPSISRHNSGSMQDGQDDNRTSYYKPYGTEDDLSLVKNAATMGNLDKSKNVDELEYQDPYANRDTGPQQFSKLSGLDRFYGGRYPLEQRIENKKRGIGRQRYPFLVWILTVIMVAVFIYEIVVNAKAQGTPISFKPVVNPMLGPSESALISLGARFPPCMKNVPDVPITLDLPCLNDTANPPTEVCPISDLCAFGGIQPGATPNQWFRFITPIFLHAGIIHILLNMVAQLLVSAQLEREMGTGGFFFVYFTAGIFGNILGGNFALVGVPSVGASGAIFGTVAVSWVDLLAHWKYQYRPRVKLFSMTVELILGVAMGFIPYVDNFAHLGGFLMGLLVGMFFYPIISETRRHKLITWGFRIAALPLVIVLFVVLTRNFYTTDPTASCHWCRYLSCIPTSANNHCQGTGITTTTTTTTGSSSLRFLL